jgi:uncharacterized protein YdeI (YjbR/CyaY-like superfamily)
MATPTIPEVRAATRAAWRRWLATHHASSDTIWLVYPKKDTAITVRGERLTYQAIVEEALCFGWIDSVPRKRTDGWAMLRVSPRKPRSVWSAINKAHVARLTAAGKMAPAGLAAVAAAQQNGSWTRIDSAEALEMPEDLTKALAKRPVAKRHFDAFPPGSKKIILQWITTAKKPETRAARIATTVSEAAENRRANHARQPLSAAPRAAQNRAPAPAAPDRRRRG